MAKKQVQIVVLPGGASWDWVLLAADSLARVRRLLGWDVSMYGIVSDFAQVFQINPDSPEERRHASENVLAQLILSLQQSGDVYKRTAKCPVCQNCGRPEPGQSRCSACGGTVTKVERDGYFLRINRRTPDIHNLLANSNLIMPSFQQGSLISSFNNRSAEDILIALGIAREKMQFIPSGWFKLLAETLARTGYSGDEGAFKRLWSQTFIFSPMDTIFNWCGVLSALSLPLPGGFIYHSPLIILDGKGQEVSPMLLAKNYGHEALRYFILAVKIAPGENTFSEDQVLQRINHDLANELGNLVSRVISLVSRFSDGMIPAPDILTRQTGDLELRETALDAPRKIEQHIQAQEFFQAIKTVKNLIGKTNRFIETTVPWQLAASGAHQARLNTVLYNLCEALRFLAVSLKPLLPEAAQSILYQLGIADIPSITSWDSLKQWGLIPVDTRSMEQPALFPRIVPGFGGLGPEPDLIMREELARISMIVARVVSAEPVADYEGLLQLILYDGRQRSRVLAPVAHTYKPSSLSGKKVILISNLRPLEIEGLHSEGEVLVTEAEAGNLQLIIVEDDIPEGSKVLCLS